MDPGLITQWWTETPNANIGIATGLSNALGLDVDTKEYEKDGRLIKKVGAETLKALTEEYGELPETFTVQTYSGGWHHYFLMPEPRLGNTTGTVKAGLGPDVDTRGDGGYVVAAPSVVESNGVRGQYRVTVDAPPAELPAWVADKLTPRKPYVAPGRASTPPADRRTGEILEGFQGTPEGLRRRKAALLQEIRDLPQGGVGTQPVNDIALELGHYIPHQLHEDETRDELQAAVNTWEDGHDKGFKAIETGLPDGMADPKIWEERRTQGGVNAFTDAYMADTIARNALVESYCWTAGMGWLQWTGKVWKPCDESAVVDAIRLFVIDRTEDAVRRMRIPEEETAARVDLAGWSRFHTAAKLRGIAGLVKKPVTVDDADLDSHRDLLNCTNGVVDLRTGEVKPHDPQLLMTRICAADYDPQAECNDWTAILTAMGDGVRGWMQIVVGQAATGYRTDRDLVPVLQGGGDNGKSTFMASVAQALGTYHAMVPDELLLGRAQRDESMVLRGARFALIEETPEGAYLNAAMLKKVTSPQMTGHNLYAKTVSWNATHTLFMTTNYKPVITESDDGTWRRVALVRFPFKFVRGEPQKEHHRKGDPTLIRRVETGDQKILRAALRWIVDGAQKWYAANMVLPELPSNVETDTRAWRMEKDLILGVWAELLEPDPESHVATMDVWSQFENWAKARGHANPGTLRSFVPKFEEHPETTNNGVTRKDGVRATKGGLSRPPDSYGPPLPQQFSAFLGVRFRQRNATPTDAVTGMCDPCDPKNETPLREEALGKVSIYGSHGSRPEKTADQSPAPIRRPGRPFVPPGRNDAPPAA